MLTVRVEVDVVVVAGLNEHVAPAGKLPQVNVTGWLKPLVGVIWTLNVAAPPASTLAEDAPRAMLKPAVGGVPTFTVTVRR